MKELRDLHLWDKLALDKDIRKLSTELTCYVDSQVQKIDMQYNEQAIVLSVRGLCSYIENTYKDLLSKTDTNIKQSVSDLQTSVDNLCAYVKNMHSDVSLADFTTLKSSVDNLQKQANATDTNLNLSVKNILNDLNLSVKNILTDDIKPIQTSVDGLCTYVKELNVKQEDYILNDTFKNEWLNYNILNASKKDLCQPIISVLIAGDDADSIETSAQATIKHFIKGHDNKYTAVWKWIKQDPLNILQPEKCEGDLLNSSTLIPSKNTYGNTVIMQYHIDFNLYETVSTSQKASTGENQVLSVNSDGTIGFKTIDDSVPARTKTTKIYFKYDKLPYILGVTSKTYDEIKNMTNINSLFSDSANFKQIDKVYSENRKQTNEYSGVNVENGWRLVYIFPSTNKQLQSFKEDGSETAFTGVFYDMLEKTYDHSAESGHSHSPAVTSTYYIYMSQRSGIYQTTNFPNGRTITFTHKA